MLIEQGNKIHIIYRALYENSTRRHFIGEVRAVDGALCRLEGYAFIYDPKLTTYMKKEERRNTIVDVSDSGYIVNIVDSAVDLDKVSYKYLENIGLAATDGEHFILNINEFGTKS